jgi:hypothetical protein
MARIKKAQSGGKFSDIYTGPAKTNPGVLKAKADKAKADSNISAYKKNAEEKLKMAKQLYKDNPGKVFKTAVDSAQARLLRVPKQKSGGSTPAWQRKEGKNPEGGLNAKGVASYRAANPGSKLKTAVTTKPSKLKAGSKDAKRRKSFCARMSGVEGPMKKPNGKPTRKALALRKWNC